MESLDGTTLNVVAAPPKGLKAGSIRHLEAALATLVGESTARKTTAVFAGVNELRQADAHMPSSDLSDALKLAGIAETGVAVHEARQMVHQLVDALYAIARFLASSKA